MRPFTEPQPGTDNLRIDADSKKSLQPSLTQNDTRSKTPSVKRYLFWFTAFVLVVNVFGAYFLGIRFTTTWGGMVLLGVAMFPGKGWIRKRGQEKEQERGQDTLTLWREAVAARSELMDTYATLRINPLQALDHSLLWDEKHPQAQIFTDAYTKVTDLKAGSQVELPENQAEYESFVGTVTEAKAAFDQAVAEAKEKGLGAFTEEEQENARRARELLSTALNEKAENTERSLAAARATVMLATLRSISLPNEMRLELDTVRKMINAPTKARAHHDITLDV